jgi:hypothetical protein
MIRLLLIALSLAPTLPSTYSQAPAVQYHSFEDLLEAVRTLRRKTIVEAYFRLEAPQFTAYPIFSPDAKGEAFFVFPVARILPEAPPPDELENALSSMRRSTLFAPSYDAKRRRLAFYPPEAVADFRVQLAPWVLTPDEMAKRPYLRFTEEAVVARIPLDREAEFLDVLVTAFLHTNRKDLKCIVGWN